MVFETNVDIIQIKGFMNLIQTQEGRDRLRKRFALANQMKSFNNAMILDAQEEIKTKTNTFAGLPELLEKYALFLVGASDIPATRLLGSSASGLNATGEGDLKNYYDTSRSAQKSVYKPKLDYFDKIMVKSLGLPDDLNLNYEFNSLFQMTPKETADLQLITAQRDALYLDRNIVTEVAVAKDLKQNETYTNITKKEIKELELEAADDDSNTNTNNPFAANKSENEEGEEKENIAGEDAERAGSSIQETTDISD